MEPFLQRSAYFNDLSLSVRQRIVQNNLHGIGTLNAMFIAVNVQLFNYLSHTLTCKEIYGVDYVQEIQRIIHRLEPNGTLIKIMLMILAFASNSSLIQNNFSIDTNDYSTPSNSISLLRIQNVLTTLIWKYLVYQYGFEEAVRRCNNLVKTYLDILHHVNANASREHWQMIDSVVKKIIQSLIINDDPVE
jgi:hypothetical protein